jgi:hypothetical protein
VFTRCHRRMLNLRFPTPQLTIPTSHPSWSGRPFGHYRSAGACCRVVPAQRYLPRLPNSHPRCPPIPNADCDRGMADGERHARCMAPHSPPTCPRCCCSKRPTPRASWQSSLPQEDAHAWDDDSRVGAAVGVPNLPPYGYRLLAARQVRYASSGSSAAERRPCACLRHVCRSLKGRGQARHGGAQAVGADAAVAADTAPQGCGTAGGRATAQAAEQQEPSLQCTESMLDEPQHCAACHQQAAEPASTGAGFPAARAVLEPPALGFFRLACPTATC